jgi:hypothetical protein
MGHVCSIAEWEHFWEEGNNLQGSSMSSPW